MSAKRHMPSNAAPQRAQRRGITADEVKTRLREEGKTLKEWAAEHGYRYDTVSCVVRGVNRGSYGMGHRIAVALGLK